MTIKKRIASLLGATLLFSLPACSSQSLDEPATETEEITVEKTPKVWVGRNLTANEQIVLKFLQERGITDKVALATIMGNIKQESKFETKICEGGARVGYSGCYSGGFGLIQWTTPSRYYGLGSHAKQLRLNPDTIAAQLSWMVTEIQWQNVEPIFKTTGLSRDAYMNAAYRWLGWGILGNRDNYTTNYINQLYML